MRIRESGALAILIGAASYVALSRLWLATAIPSGTSVWHVLSPRPLGAALTLSAGFVAGILHPKRAILCGLIAGVLGEAGRVATEAFWPSPLFGPPGTFSESIAFLASAPVAGRLCAYALHGAAGGALAAAIRRSSFVQSRRQAGR